MVRRDEDLRQVPGIVFAIATAISEIVMTVLPLPNSESPAHVEDFE
jgi:hypothetical protein